MPLEAEGAMVAMPSILDAMAKSALLSSEMASLFCKVARQTMVCAMVEILATVVAIMATVVATVAAIMAVKALILMELIHVLEQMDSMDSPESTVAMEFKAIKENMEDLDSKVFKEDTVCKDKHVALDKTNAVLHISKTSIRVSRQCAHTTTRTHSNAVTKNARKRWLKKRNIITSSVQLLTTTASTRGTWGCMTTS